MVDRLITLLETLSGLEQGQAAVDAARRLVDLDPLREASHRALMRAYHDAGETALALQQFEACKTLLKKEYGVAPAAETMLLQARIVKGEGRGTVAAPAVAGERWESPAPPGLRPSAEKPAIAVLPLTLLTEDEGLRYLADGISIDIGTELSRHRGISVIASDSTTSMRNSV